MSRIANMAQTILLKADRHLKVQEIIALWPKRTATKAPTGRSLAGHLVQNDFPRRCKSCKYPHLSVGGMCWKGNNWAEYGAKPVAA